MIRQILKGMAFTVEQHQRELALMCDSRLPDYEAKIIWSGGGVTFFGERVNRHIRRVVIQTWGL